MTVAGALLAGGRGRRMAPASKPAVVIAGRPLMHWPLVALAACCDPVAVVCKGSSALPSLPTGVERWEEPEDDFHPVRGIIAALERAGDDVLVCAGDMPLVEPATCQALLAGPEEATAVVAVAGGRLQPVLGLYRSAALDRLRSAQPDAPLTAIVESLDPAVVEVPGRVALSVDTPEAVAEAERLLSA